VTRRLECESAGNGNGGAALGAVRKGAPVIGRGGWLGLQAMGRVIIPRVSDFMVSCRNTRVRGGKPRLWGGRAWLDR
jgi:hypothetical protein